MYTTSSPEVVHEGLHSAGDRDFARLLDKHNCCWPFVLCLVCMCPSESLANLNINQVSHCNPDPVRPSNASFQLLKADVLLNHVPSGCRVQTHIHIL